MKELNSKNEKINISSLNKLLENKISLASLHNHANYIISMNIPIIKNKVVKNSTYDEKDIINKIASTLKSKNIDEIFAGEFSKFGYKNSLPNLGHKKILEYRNYIKDIHGISILDINDSRKDDNNANTYLSTSMNYLSKNKLFTVSYVSDLPKFHNGSSQILVIKNLDDNLKELWMNYLNEYLLLLFDIRINVKNSLFNTDKSLKIDTEYKKIHFLVHEKLHIENLKINDIVHLSKLNTSSNNHTYGINRQSMVLGFLIYLYINNKILLSINFILDFIYNAKKMHKELSLFESHFFIDNEYKIALDRNILMDKEIKLKRLLYLFTCSMNCENKIIDITDSCFDEIERINQNYSNTIKKLFNKLGANLEIKNTYLPYTADYYMHMNNINLKDFILLCNDYMTKKVKLKQTTNPKAYYKRISSSIVSFLNFVTEYHPSIKLTKENLKKLFDYPKNKIFTYQEYLETLEDSEKSKGGKIFVLFEIFSNTEGYESIIIKNNIPNYNTNSNLSSRKAIEDDEIIYKLDDIVTNRPPKSNYFNNHKVDMDMSWWKHCERVVPFEPLIIKLHLRIPVRGETLRLIDRDTLLVIKNENIRGFNFVSDKNKKRKEPFIVPNIWKSELYFLVNLIEYNKQSFPFLKKHYPDDITLKKGILPLFPNAEGNGAYTRNQHLSYFTKVLIQAQMEFYAENKDIKLFYNEKNDFPKNQEELDNMTKEKLNIFKRIYDIHSLRHTGITRNIKAGMPLELVRMLSGHSGFNTILTVYYHVNQEELVNNWLNKHNIDITENINMHETSELFIKKEILRDKIKAKNPEIILKTLNNYNFFNPQNRELAIKDGITLSTISESEPKFWKPLRTGICTKTQCPIEIIGRCSLCPYFITNYMFIQEIGLEMQLSMVRVEKYSKMIIKNREDGNNINNAKLKQQMNNEIENFTAWLEITSLANMSYNDSKPKKDAQNMNTFLINHTNQTEDSLIDLIPAISIEHGYLEILLESYKRKIYDNETVVDITNIMANKIIRYAINNKTYNEIEDLDSEEVIKWFLPTYKKISRNRQELTEFLTLLENKKHKLKYTNEKNILPE